VRGDRDGDDPTDELVDLGQWPRLDAQILRHRLESADIAVMVRWTGDGLRGVGTLLVPAAQAEFARAVVTEIDVDDEVPDTSPHAYITRIEEHLGAVAALLDELRARVDDDGEDNRLG
jgi:DNA-binding transcriptional LysR family regulator